MGTREPALLFSRSGFSHGLRAVAESDERVSLIDLETLAAQLNREAA